VARFVDFVRRSFRTPAGHPVRRRATPAG
jgi:hypothetical protein